MYEIQNNLPIQSQKSSDLRLFMIATRILLQQSLIEQIINEDIAIFVGDE